jgi:transposase
MATLSRKTLKTYRNTLKERVKKLNTYAKQRDIMGKRNSYSKTDNDAAFMRMKDETLKAAYNAQLAVEGEYITGAGIFATTNDGATEAVSGTSETDAGKKLCEDRCRCGI